MFIDLPEEVPGADLSILELFELAYHRADTEADELRRELRELRDQVRRLEQRIARKERIMREAAERFPIR